MAEKTNTTQSSFPRSNTPRSGAPRRPRPEGGKSFADRVKDVDQKIIDIRRVTRVVSGGRRMSFAVSMIIGDKKGVVGLGTGKGNDTALAIAKALKDAKKHALKIKLTKTNSLPHSVEAKYTSSRIMMLPNKGKGLVAGAAVRDILVLAGVKDVTSKVLSGSKNKLNTARATMKALAHIATPHIFTVPRIEAVSAEETIPEVKNKSY